MSQERAVFNKSGVVSGGDQPLTTFAALSITIAGGLATQTTLHQMAHRMAYAATYLPTQRSTFIYRSLHTSTQQLPSNRNDVDERKRTFEAKYANQLRQAVKKRGVKDIDSLKQIIATERASNSKQIDEYAKQMIEKAKSAKLIETPAPTNASSTSSLVKPLDSILDVAKIRSQTPAMVSKLWNAYHLSKSSKLSAAIPIDVYQNMWNVAKQYPSFVIPVPRSSAIVPEGDATPMEMYYLQWSALPQTASTSQSSEIALPTPTSVLFTPLGEYKLRQTFAQPALVLTHYTDLADSHGLVLLRGDLVEKGVGASLNGNEAQLLVLRLQQYFNWCQSEHGISSTNADAQARRDLLVFFHEQPESFSVDRLVSLSRDI